MILPVDAKIVKALDPLAAAAADDRTVEVDTAGYTDVTCLLFVDSCATASALKAQQSDTSGSGQATLDGAEVTVTTDANQVYYLHISTPLERYITFWVDKAGATQESAIVILSNPSEAPVAAHGSGVSGTVVYSPAEA